MAACLKRAASVQKASSICEKDFSKAVRFEAYIMSNNCALALDIHVLIYDNHELDRILESTNSDNYELINLSIEQHDDLSQEHMGVRMAPTLDTSRMSGSDQDL